MSVLPNNNNRIIFADILRISATFLIIVFHLCTDKWYAIPVDNWQWSVANFFVTQLRFCVPLFFMLSGMTFLNPSKPITLQKLYSKNILHILLALIFWSISYKLLASTVSILQGTKEFSVDLLLNNFTNFIYETPWLHLWFLYALISIYILVPILRLITANTSYQIFCYLLILYFFTNGILPFLNNTFNIYILLFKIPDLIGYTGYFLAGYFFYKYELKKSHRTILYICAAIALGYSYIHSEYKALDQGFPSIFYYFDNNSITNIPITCAIFVYAKKWFSNRKDLSVKLQNSRLIRQISSNCFGIYLSHMLFFNVLILIGINITSFNVLISIPVLTIGIFIMSYIATETIKRIPRIGNWIV